MKRNNANNVKSSKKAKLNHDDEPLIKFDPKLFETVPQEILIEIFRLVPSETLTNSLVFVSKNFHQIIYNPQNSFFDQTLVLFPFEYKIPNFSLVKCLEMKKNFLVEKKHFAALKKLNIEKLYIPLQEDFEYLPIIENYFSNLKYLFFGQILNDELWKLLQKLPNLQVLKVVDLEESEFENANLNLTDLEVVMDYSYATYGYDENGPLNFNKTVQSIFKSCPKLERIQFHADSFYINLSLLYKIITDHWKQLELITLSILEDVDPNTDSEPNQVQKIDFDCSFLAVRANKSMAIVLKYLFPNCEITILESSIKGKKITRELLEKRKILKHENDLQILENLLVKAAEDEDDQDDDEEEDDEEEEEYDEDGEDDGL
ncbi:hypothetical protein NAEGRDRAFT_63435 [Naegleria gruberi]|uniref:F-box domain-containing protein n=1 Tax=Naegleria gruberi TaxID=5762 RepID=D2V3P1_NAEGR|nr:uncharacterized protein NAEGRDRAFT_63435 [Naegleria gruberi]EFC48805.1 hypothetical protein NAEGRDRAFT_63435 [Naegleria gruberi]|eukprot:XP_002681549.1 hypothetical protein NAEGRDRAFT_63435 [Naegleria gruberi strain NEG-M]